MWKLIIRSAKTRDFCATGFFANREIFTEFTIFGNTKQVIQDYDTVFDNSIPFRKNDLLRITYFRTPGRDTRPGRAAADEYNLNVVDCNASVTVARPAVFHLSGVLPAAGGKRERYRVGRGQKLPYVTEIFCFKRIKIGRRWGRAPGVRGYRAGGAARRGPGAPRATFQSTPLPSPFPCRSPAERLESCTTAWLGRTGPAGPAL